MSSLKTNPQASAKDGAFDASRAFVHRNNQPTTTPPLPHTQTHPLAMLTNDIRQGTTPEVLQHYLTAGIEIMTSVGRARLTGITLFNGGSVAVDDGVGYSAVLRIADCIPVLRPFSHLCDLLPDGTVPVVELLKSYCLVPGDFDWQNAQAVMLTPHPGISEAYGRVNNIDGSSFITLSVFGDWSMSEWAALDIFKIHDALRRMHFAVGLASNEFIEKPAPSSTIEKGNAPTSQNS